MFFVLRSLFFPRRGGFTLIELMITVLIVAIVMALLYGVVASTVQAAQRIEEILLGAEVGPAILAQIREDIEGVFLTDANAEQFVGLNRQGAQGGRDRIDFLSTTMSYDRENEGADPRFCGLNEVGYQVQDRRDDTSLGILYRRIDPFVDADPLKGGRLVEMYDRVRVFEVEFIDDPTKPPVPEWNNKEAKGKLPRAVKIGLTISVAVRGGEAYEDRHYTMTVTLRE
ncbi:MAG: prepilin-type N-terminal cleavage/methylation domain-containing protein [Planctomycetes bacterium]|nr:prepilin-type N-terminal cleavage/methylation domain-containing protein [Planctomycetota bacterium]